MKKAFLKNNFFSRYTFISNEKSLIKAYLDTGQVPGQTNIPKYFQINQYEKSVFQKKRL